MDKSNGIALAYLTAIVSGIAVFVNSFGVLTLDSTAYTLLKNALVAGVLGALCVSLGNWREFLSLNRKQVLMLLFIGVVGGGIAFALYFAGVAMTGGAVGSFLYRLLFIFAAAIGVVALREKFSWKTAAGVLAVLAGDYILLGGAALALSEGALLILAAAVLWAIEYAVAKKALENLSPTVVGAASLGIGAPVLLAILAYNGKISVLGQVSVVSFAWIAVGAAFLTIFTTLWYSALKHATLISSTAALTLGGPITALLSFALAGKALTVVQAGGFLLLAAGVIFVVGTAETVAAFYWLRERSRAIFRL